MTPMTIDARSEMAARIAGRIVAETHLRARVWIGGERVRVYVSDGRDRGYLDVTPAGAIQRHVTGCVATIERLDLGGRDAA